MDWIKILELALPATIAATISGVVPLTIFVLTTGYPVTVAFTPS